MVGSLKEHSPFKNKYSFMAHKINIKSTFIAKAKYKNVKEFINSPLNL